MSIKRIVDLLRLLLSREGRKAGEVLESEQQRATGKVYAEYSQEI